MIDMHNHVLYGVDDGAQTLDDSLEMLRVAEALGFDTVVLTPHYMIYEHYTSPVAENARRLVVLQKAAQEAGIGVRLYLGNELLYDYKMIERIDTGAFKALGDTNWCLVETIRHAGSVASLNTFRIKLRDKGYRMILAHPERYDFVQDDPNSLIDFMEQGCLIQANYLSLTGYYGNKAKETLEPMLTHNMVQLMGSDAHQVEGYERYPEAEAAGIRLIGEAAWKQIMDVNPRLLLTGQVHAIPVTPNRSAPKVRKSVIARRAI